MMQHWDESFRWKYYTDAEFAARVNLAWKEQERRDKEARAEKERGAEKDREA